MSEQRCKRKKYDDSNEEETYAKNNEIAENSEMDGESKDKEKNAKGEKNIIFECGKIIADKSETVKKDKSIAVVKPFLIRPPPNRRDRDAEPSTSYHTGSPTNSSSNTRPSTTQEESSSDSESEESSGWLNSRRMRFHRTEPGDGGNVRKVVFNSSSDLRVEAEDDNSLPSIEEDTDSDATLVFSASDDDDDDDIIIMTDNSETE